MFDRSSSLSQVQFIKQYSRKEETERNMPMHIRCDTLTEVSYCKFNIPFLTYKAVWIKLCLYQL